MGYYNIDRINMVKIKFIKKMQTSRSVNGLIVVDLPWPENNRTFAKKCKKNSINFVQLISPTTSKYRVTKNHK